MSQGAGQPHGNVRAFLSCEATNAVTLAPFSESCTAQIQAWRLFRRCALRRRRCGWRRDDPGKPPDRRGQMTIIDTARQRLQEADGLAAVLDAAYAAFEGMVSVIHPVQDPASGLFTAFVMAAASAADGRNALALAPSLPGHPLLAGPAEQRPWPGAPPERVAEVVAGLSHLVAERLTQAAA